MFTTSANFILALLEERPVAASRILRDAGGSKDINVQGIQKRLEEAIERKETQAQFNLANGILTESLRIEFRYLDCDSLRAFIESLEAPYLDGAGARKIAEEAFEMGRRSVESIVELHATQFSAELSRMEKPTFLEVNAI
jgi:hypothetical protein